MTYQELSKCLAKYSAAIFLDKLIGYRKREGISKFIYSTTVLLFVLFIISKSAEFENHIQLGGLFYIFLSFSFFIFALNSYYNFYYLNDIEIILNESALRGKDQPGSFILASVLFSSNWHDPVKGLFKSPTGKALMVRLGISDEDMENFLAFRKDIISSEDLILESDGKNPFAEYVLAIFRKDKALSDFLFSKGVKEAELNGVLDWLVRSEAILKARKRFWGRDSLGRLQGIGKNWSYGQIYTLLKYGRHLEKMYNIASRGSLSSTFEKAGELEIILSRSEEANAIIVSDDDILRRDLVIALGKKIFNGSVLTSLEHKVIIVLDTNALIAETGSKNNFESELIKIFNEAVKAGNIILVIEDLPSFIISARSLGSDVVSLADSYWSSSGLQVVAMSDTTSFHEIIEKNLSLSQRFEKIIIRDDGYVGLLRALEDKASELESQYGVIFTFQAILTVAENASRYFIGDIVSDKAVDMLIELPSHALKAKRKIVKKEDVLGVVEIKTGVPQGEIKTEEKEKLINLETILHKRIVGQDEAVKAISSAMRRSRSGIESASRPLSSFLFLGPTGVGKTETTKALAEVFFGSEAKIMRLDMSEYNSADALTRLIGYFENDKAGVLSSMVRENPYGVLLLDEFEKANKDIHDLFLQILDEGIFSDMRGKKVGARNLIIIATSNAGSDLIWEYIKNGKNISENKSNIIDAIIKAGIFKPELLNRFDGVILFNPLTPEQLRKVASLSLERLQKRLEAKNMRLGINDDLLNYLVKVGSDPKFGARPINRAIQDKIESLVAEKMIRGEIKEGSTVSLKREELEKIA